MFFFIFKLYIPLFIILSVHSFLTVFFPDTFNLYTVEYRQTADYAGAPGFYKFSIHISVSLLSFGIIYKN